MKRFLLTFSIALAFLGVSVGAQDSPPIPNGKVTLGAVIAGRDQAKADLASATDARLKAETALADARTAEANATTNETRAETALAKALALSGPVIVVDSNGKATVYELNPDGSPRVIVPTPADQASVDLTIPPTTEPPAPMP